MLAAKMLKELELEFVGVLILIDHNISIMIAYLFSERWIFIQYPVGEHQEIIKIYQVVFENILFVGLIDFGYFFYSLGAQLFQ